MVVIATALFTAIFGPEMWMLQVSGCVLFIHCLLYILLQVFGIPLNLLTIGTTTVLAIIQGYWYLMTAFTGGIGKNGSTVAVCCLYYYLLVLLFYVNNNIKGHISDIPNAAYISSGYRTFNDLLQINFWCI